MAVIKTIKDETLTALGDAIRSKTGVKYVIVDEPTNVEPFYSITIDTSTIQWGSSLSYKIDMYDLLKTALGDKYDLTTWLYFTFEYETNNEQAYYVATGNSDMTHSIVFKNYEGINRTNGFLEKHYCSHFVIVARQSDLDSGATLTYTIKIWACDANKKFIALNKYTPLEMVDKINGLDTIPNSALHFTGNASYRFASNGLNWLIEQCGSKITTENLTNINYMFFECDKLEEIPFVLNTTGYQQVIEATYLFYRCSKLKTIPMINKLRLSSGSTSNMFSNCTNIRYFPEGFGEDWNYNDLHNSSYGGLTYLFQSCQSLREAPLAIVKNLYSKCTSSYSCSYCNTFAYCTCLDEIRELGVNLGNVSSNLFTSTFTSTFRLKDLTFDTNEDGTPKTAPWRNQTIDLTSYVGYCGGTYAILDLNSGITADKQVTDDTTYQALKNDPDWFSTDINYSRYNHDSAVNTINSLPDTSAYGTNTIKFKGAAGALTDGGAINTLTEEEIAVAAAKGWTVTLS